MTEDDYLTRRSRQSVGRSDNLITIYFRILIAFSSFVWDLLRHTLYSFLRSLIELHP